MAITKKRKNYWLDIRIKGKRIRRSLKTDNYELALDKAKELKDKLAQEHDKDSIKFSDFCKQYLEWAWSEKPASARGEQFKLRKIQSFFAELKIENLIDITPFHIEKLKAWLKDNDIAKPTINRYLQLLRGMFYRAIDWEKYDKPNPLKKVKFYKEESRIKPLSHAQVRRVLEAAFEISFTSRSFLQKAFYDILILVMNTGLRKSEVLNLRWRNIKYDIIEIEGKGGKLRTIPLNEIAMKIINKQSQKNVYVFDVPNRDQQSLFKRTLIQIKEKVGFRFHLHQLRHYFATTLLEMGSDLVTISDLLGHSKVTTSLMYSHTNEDRKRQAVKKLEE